MKISKKFFLVTTAEKSTWPSKALSILFLGEWCRLYNRRQYWEYRNTEVVPYHWDDRRKLNEDFLYLINLHETLLLELSQKLNTIHGVNHSLRYWRILIGPWLGYFTQILFDRWSSLKQVERGYDIEGTIILKGGEENLIPNDMNSFIQMYLGDEWNHYIYSLILQHSKEIKYTQEERLRTGSKSKDFLKASGLAKLKTTIRKFISGSLNLLQRSDDVFFITTYLSSGDELKLNAQLKQFPQFRERIKPQVIKTDFDQRKWVLPGDSLLEFENCVRTIIPLQLPKIYLEGYSSLIRQSKLLTWPERPKAIFTSNSHHSDDLFNAWAAQKVENGSPLLIGQHGGHYGIGKWSFVENHEIAISDAFISWGWSDDRNPKIKPVGMLKRKLPFNINHAEQANILLVKHINPRQSYHLFSSAMAGQWIGYLQDQFRFVESLPQNIKNALIVRLHPQDWGWAPYKRWKDKFPALRIDKGGTGIMDSIRVSRIFVSTYNATTFLESLAMDVPTVIYWNTNHWELRDSAIPYFEELKRIGVFHETPESAANHVALVWDDVNTWWNRNDVREVLDSFKENYCDTSNDIVKDLGNIIKEFYRN